MPLDNFNAIVFVVIVRSRVSCLLFKHGGNGVTAADHLVNCVIDQLTKVTRTRNFQLFLQCVLPTRDWLLTNVTVPDHGTKI